MRKKRNYYSVLQLNRFASPEAIEAAYTRLARQYDPATSNKPGAAQRLQDIQEAYDVLSSKERRAEYDQQRRRREAGPLGNVVELLLASFRRRPLLFGGIAGPVLTGVVLMIIWLAVLSGEDGETGAAATPAAGNLFANPGFEEGRDPWPILDSEISDFILSEDPAHSGKNSALLQMRSPAGRMGTKVFYVVQDLQLKDFPDVISGYYRVDKWTKGTAKQYLQFVVIAIGAEGLDPIPQEFSGHQIRYVLAGIDQEPSAFVNAHFVFLRKEEPILGEWVYFERNIKQDFQELWGGVPTDFDSLRLFFEVRYDNKSVNDGLAEADVYYDDLYIGPTQSPRS